MIAVRKGRGLTVIADPSLGTVIMGRGTMNFPYGGTKFEYESQGITIHYMMNVRGIFGDFKLK